MIDASKSEEKSIALCNQLQTELDDVERLLQWKVDEVNTQFVEISKMLDRERHSTLQSHERECL